MRIVVVLPESRMAKIGQDSIGFWISRRGLWISGTGFWIHCHWNLDSGLQSLMGFGFLELNSPFAAFHSRGTKPPCWDAKVALGQDQQKACIIFLNGNVLCFSCPIATFAFCTTWMESCKGPIIQIPQAKISRRVVVPESGLPYIGHAIQEQTWRRSLLGLLD